ncbi:hypothetical protein URH17368_0509 [Alicyclobacillus hesperidum URH17-3-68]|uniref:Uncharacterized protein family (UPF0236) n=1 Tax=Alicyclobacillus hesperidum TaxID=89784 RepID=A0A1H2Y5K6_9BACL|nr:ISLre2 family transposase [Alicyclobacillus hesperidum]EJY56810.1 hypothetical protein URH17368_0509 [Alicyclobacillus hesperidum URH17-3-68]GLV14931.1 hypothetical protein Heshes_26160 [Alicyclobacillus hesperidum]SDW99944.1 Uncharacterised protein family (UPF0236) [Alicyclobacillus hesperidum]
MLNIRRSYASFLSLVMTAARLSQHPGDFAVLEEEVSRALTSLGAEVITSVLEAWDEKLVAERDRNEWELVQCKPRTIVSTVGEITYRRRYYRNRKTGERRFLLDDAAGFDPRRRLSGKLRNQAVALALDVSYRRAAEILQTWVPDISAMAIWQEVQRLGGEKRARAELEREKVFEQGEVPSGTSKVETLFVEADGVYVRGRRAEDGQSHFELKVAVAYEGKQEQGRERRALMNRQVVVGTEEAERFWEGAVASFGRVWDWVSVKRCWVGADGAEWAKKGVEMLPGARYRLDPFHLRRAIAGALGRETQAYRKVWDAVGSGDWSQVEKVLRKAESQSEGAKKQRISKLKSYMEKNWEGIVSDGDVVSLGTIEGQVFHHVARRMKRHGARWSKSGADALVRLVADRSNQEPLRVRRLSRFEVQPNELANGKQVNEAELTRHAKEAVRWLERQMPALVAPHADRPWVKYVLRELSRISFTVA